MSLRSFAALLGAAVILVVFFAGLGAFVAAQDADGLGTSRPVPVADPCAGVVNPGITNSGDEQCYAPPAAPSVVPVGPVPPSGGGYGVPDVDPDLDLDRDGGGFDVNWCRRWWC